MERMMRENNEKMLREITEQFSEFAMANRETSIFSCQPETNHKGGSSTARLLIT